MKHIIFILALLPLSVVAQPALTDNALLRYLDDNASFHRPLSDLRTQLFPSGTNTYTMYYNGSAWAGSSLLQVRPTQVTINALSATIDTAYKLVVKQTGASTSTGGIAVYRSNSTNIARVYHNGAATFESVGGNNLALITASGSLINLVPGGGGGQQSQVQIAPGSNVTTTLGNAAMMNVFGTYAPTTSGGDFSAFRLGTTFNMTGTSNQRVKGLLITPTLTAIVNGFYGVEYRPSNPSAFSNAFLWQPIGAAVRNHLAGDLSIGADTTLAAAKVQIQGDGATSSTYSLIVTNSGAATSTAALSVRDDSRVGINTNAPAVSLHVAGTDGVRLASGTTAQRPSGTPAGVLRWNTDSTKVEVGTGSTWLSLSTGGGGGAADGNGIYDGSGTIPPATIATVSSGEVFGFDYSDSDLAIAINDDDGEVAIFDKTTTSQIRATASNISLSRVSGGNLTVGASITANTGGGNVIIGGGATASEVQLLEPSGSGSNYTAVKAQAQAANITYTLPAANAVGEMRNDGSGGLSWGPSVITPSQITSTQNDYAPTGWATAQLVRLSSDADFDKITGFSAGVSGEVKTLTNIGSYCLYLAPEHTGSSAANRISYQEEVILWPGSSCQIFYDGTSSRWRVLATPSPGYQVPRRAKYFYEPISRASTAAAMDNVTDLFGSITMSEADASSTELFNSWAMTTGATTSGGAGMYMPHDHTGAYVTTSHIVAKTLVKMPATLGDATNNYYYFVRIADSPSSGFWDQNNSVGIYYRYSDNSGKFYLRSRSSGGTNTEVDSGITVAVNTTYELQVSLNKASNEATFWIDGAVVGRITTNLPSGTNVGFSAQLEKTAGNSSRTCHTFYLIGAAIAP